MTSKSNSLCFIVIRVSAHTLCSFEICIYWLQTSQPGSAIVKSGCSSLFIKMSVGCFYIQLKWLERFCDDYICNMTKWFILSNNSGIGVMTQSVKFAAHAQTAMLACACEHNAEAVQTGGSLELTGQADKQNRWSPGSARCLFSIRWITAEEAISWWSLAFPCTHILIHGQLHKHTHTYPYTGADAHRNINHTQKKRKNNSLIKFEETPDLIIGLCIDYSSLAAWFMLLKSH